MFILNLRGDVIKETREGFSSNIVVFFATLSSAVGLGNIWKFPYMIGENGGAAFILIYLLCVLGVGLPVMLSEFIIGRNSKKNVIGSIKDATSKKPFKLYGFFGILAGFAILFFYTTVAGWIYSYIIKTLFGVFKGTSPESAAAIFNQTTLGPLEPVLWQILVVVVASSVLILGVRSGIEKLARFGMPVLLILLAICAVRGLFLEGGAEALRYLFVPDFSNLSIVHVVMTALGLAFFKLSLGMGTMLTYASYFPDNSNLFANAIKVVIGDTIVSLLAGIAIFPSVFTFGIEPGAGPALLFETIPLIFSQLPGGNILMVIFFCLTGLAATMAMISIFEVPVAYLAEETKISRKLSVILTAVIVLVIGALTTLSFNPNALLGGFRVFGMTIFDFFDHLSSNILMPIGGLLIAILAGYFLSKDVIRREMVEKNGVSIQVMTVYYFILRYITPILLIVVSLSALKII